ncbi:MAG TPA: histidine kinase [Kaistiaceae bacterium]|nr:histidine kinase [Kaistiaceae bacterium]
MPTLFRFLTVVAVIAGLVFAGLTALAIFVEPQPRDMTIAVPKAKLRTAAPEDLSAGE